MKTTVKWGRALSLPEARRIWSEIRISKTACHKPLAMKLEISSRWSRLLRSNGTRYWVFRSKLSVHRHRRKQAPYKEKDSHPAMHKMRDVFLSASMHLHMHWFIDFILFMRQHAKDALFWLKSHRPHICEKAHHHHHHRQRQPVRNYIVINKWEWDRRASIYSYFVGNIQRYR